MLVPQIVVSKRLRRQLKNGETPENAMTMGIFFESSESKESPRPIRWKTPISSALGPSPISSPPLNEHEHDHEREHEEDRHESQKINVESKEENRKIEVYSNYSNSLNTSTNEKKQTEERKRNSSTSSNSSVSSTSTTSLSSFSSTTSSSHSKKKTKNSNSQNPSSSRRKDSKDQLQRELKHSLFGFFTILFVVLILILGDQDIFVSLYHRMSPVPTNHNLIPRSERFYDSRILSTGIVTPLDGVITSDSILKWWVDGAFLSPGGFPSKRNITLRVLYNERQLQFPEGNTIEIQLNGKLDLHVDLAKYGLGFYTINGTSTPGAHEIILEVNIEPLPTDLFYSQTSSGKQLLSATANSTFYYIPPSLIEELSNNTPRQQSQQQSQQQVGEPQEQEKIEEVQQNLFQSTSPEHHHRPPPRPPVLFDFINPTQEVKQSEDSSLASSSSSSSPAPPVVNKPVFDRHRSLKQVSIRSDGGCNEKAGPRSLQLVFSLSEQVLTSDLSSTTGFGQAVLVIDERVYDLTTYFIEQLSTRPYRLLPPQDDSDLPYRLKDVPLRLDGVDPQSKLFMQLFFCHPPGQTEGQERDSQEESEEIRTRRCIQNSYTWDTLIAVCV